MALCMSMRLVLEACRRAPCLGGTVHLCCMVLHSACCLDLGSLSFRVGLFMSGHALREVRGAGPGALSK